MIYKLQYWLKSELLETKTSEMVSDDLNFLMDQIETRNDNGEAWTILVNKDIFKNGFKENPTKDDLIENNGWFTVLDSETERNELTAKVNINEAYKSKGIDALRTDALRIYDVKKITRTPVEIMAIKL